MNNVDARIKFFLESLNLPNEDCVSIFKRKDETTEMSLEFEFRWSLGFLVSNQIKFQNLNSVAKYSYHIRIKLENYSDEEIITGVRDSLKSIMNEIKRLRLNENSNDLPIGIYVKDPNEDSFHEINLK